MLEISNVLKLSHWKIIQKRVISLSKAFRNLIPKLETCYLNYASSHGKLNRNASFQKSSSVTFVDNCKYMPASKSDMLPSHNMPSCKKSIISPSIQHASTLSIFFHSTMPGQNIQYAIAYSKSVTCSAVKSNFVNSDPC